MYKDTTMLFHLGVPSETVEFLTASLLKSPRVLGRNGIMVRRPKVYRAPVKRALAELEGQAFSQESRKKLFAKLTQDYRPQRFLMSNRRFLAPTSDIFMGGEFYGQTAKNSLTMRALFPENPAEFFLEIQNPAIFIPRKFNTLRGVSYEAFMGGIDVRDVRWSSVIEKLQVANPDCKITCWRQEDTPVNWPMVLRAVIGSKIPSLLAGDTDAAEHIMPEMAAKRMIAFLRTHSDLSIPQRRTVVSAFLEKTISNKMIEAEIDLPGWNQTLIQDLSNTYQDDVEKCALIPGVSFIR